LSSAPVDVSVVIPVYNGEGYIREAIESVFLQTGLSLEVIVVDNLSSDSTWDVVGAYGGGVILASEKRRGAAAARNTGVRLATGKYLAFLDADDVWLPGKLERQVGKLAALPGRNLVFGHCQEFHDPGLSAEQRAQFACRSHPYAFLAPSACILEREVAQRIGEFPEVTAGEFIAWYGWAQSLGIGTSVIPEVCVRRRVHAQNTTRDRQTLAGFPLAAKWLLDRRRQIL